MRLRTGIVVGAAAAVVLAGTIGIVRSVDSSAAVCQDTSTTASGHTHHGRHHQGMRPHFMVGESCNHLELNSPSASTYVPDIAGASARDRAMARDLLDGVDAFCRSNSADVLARTWWPGSTNPDSPTHLFNPEPRARGLDPANPRAALVYDGRLRGVMFSGMPLLPLGSIPRAHIHHGDESVEMLHVYCGESLRDAFTPNRQIGVMAEVKQLRLSIRPAVMNLDPAELRDVRGTVRAYAGPELAPVPPVGSAVTPGPDPVLQAMRIEVRRSLMVLTEAELRSLKVSMRLA